jgi:hypothetical protein
VKSFRIDNGTPLDIIENKSMKWAKTHYFATDSTKKEQAKYATN